MDLSEHRKYQRRRLRGSIDVTWVEPGGETARVTGSCVDVSLRGMLVEIPSPIAPGTKVSVWLHGPAIPGEGVVRHCRPCATWFRVGLQFSDVILVKENHPDLGASLVNA